MQCAATRFSRHKLRWYGGGVLVLFCGGLGWFFKLCDGPFVAQGKWGRVFWVFSCSVFSVWLNETNHFYSFVFCFRSTLEVLSWLFGGLFWFLHPGVGLLVGASWWSRLVGVCATCGDIGKFVLSVAVLWVAASLQWFGSNNASSFCDCFLGRCSLVVEVGCCLPNLQRYL